MNAKASIENPVNFLMDCSALYLLLTATGDGGSNENYNNQMSQLSEIHYILAKEIFDTKKENSDSQGFWFDFRLENAKTLVKGYQISKSNLEKIYITCDAFRLKLPILFQKLRANQFESKDVNKIIEEIKAPSKIPQTQKIQKIRRLIKNFMVNIDKNGVDYYSELDINKKLFNLFK